MLQNYVAESECRSSFGTWLNTALFYHRRRSAVRDEGVRFRGRFQVVSAVDGQPVGGPTVRVRLTDGQYLPGPTDADGFTEWVERNVAESLAFDISEQDKRAVE